MARRQRPKLDDRDLEIIRQVIDNPEATVEQIAQKLPFASSTVQKRLAAMLETDRLARVIEVRDWTAAEFPFRYRIDLLINQIALREPAGGGPILPGSIDPAIAMAAVLKELREAKALMVLNSADSHGFNKEDAKAILRAGATTNMSAALEQGDDDEKTAPIVLPKPIREINSQKRLAWYIKNQLSHVPAFKKRLVCLDVTILLGHQYDMTVTIRARDTDAALDYVTKGLRFLRGVSATMSTVEAWSCTDAEHTARGSMDVQTKVRKLRQLGYDVKDQTATRPRTQTTILYVNGTEIDEQFADDLIAGASFEDVQRRQKRWLTEQL